MNRRRMRERVLRVLALAAMAAVLLVSCDNALGPAGIPAEVQEKGGGGGDSATVRVNVLLNTALTDAARAQLSQRGKIVEEIPQIQCLVLQTKAAALADIRALPFVEVAGLDQERKAPPVTSMAATDFTDGLSSWDLDAIGVTDYGFDNRQVAQDGEGVYVAVLDTGLVSRWRHYFPEERIAVQLAKCFGGGGGEVGEVSEQPNKWERDTNSHGTHVTSTILGYSMSGVPVNGVAPRATVIPVKVLNQNGSGWSAMVAHGIVYVTDLTLPGGPLEGKRVVINMSLGGPVQEPVEKAAVDYAVANGVILVASAGNEGERGMGYPGAYEPVISVAASGWVGEWSLPPGDYFRTWWYLLDVPEGQGTAPFYITDFSSRELSGQRLDVAAPGSWVVGPYQLNSGQTSYYFLGGTSMASPHVAGIVALMLQKDPGLGVTEAESILESTALHLTPGSRVVNTPYGYAETYSWGADAAGFGLVDAPEALAQLP